MKQQICEAITRYRAEILEFTQNLVAIPSENPPGVAYQACTQLLEAKLQDMGLDYQIIEVPKASSNDPYPRYCLLAFYGSGQGTLYFHGHYDVVPAANKAQFHPKVKGGKLWGRGTSDMKGGLVAMLYAVKALQDCHFEPQGRIGLTIVPDEETGGLRGSQYLTERGLLGEDGIGMLMPECTSGVIWTANRGAISLRITVRGRAVHVCLQHEGVNAFEGMLAVAQALLPLKSHVEKRATAYNIEPKAARHSILMLGGRCQGGTNFNVVPDQCSFTIDRRINPEENLATEKAHLLSLLEGLKGKGIDIEVEVLQEGESAGVSEATSTTQALLTSILEVTGKRPVFEMCPGLCELRFYARRGAPAYAYGPGILSVSHGPEEYIRIEDIYNCAAIYALTATRLLSSRNAARS